MAFPQWMTLYKPTQRQEVIRVLDQIERLLGQCGDVVYLDFRPIDRLYSDGALLAYARLEELDRRYPKRLKFVPPRDVVVDQTFSHLGFYRLLGSRRMQTATKPIVMRWSQRSGSNADGEAIGTLLEEYSHDLDEARTGLLFRGVTEAVMNCCEHAYPDDVPSEGRRWWAFTCRENDKIHVTIADLGAGIPMTLPQRFPEDVQAILGNLLRGRISSQADDGTLIRAAVELGRTRTGRYNRGKGLFDMRRSVADAPEGALFIYSNSGRYQYRKTSSFQVIEGASSYDASIRGTLISWSVPLPGSAQ